MRSSFYKYCPIYDENNLDDEYSLINLFNSQVTFSRRKNFNDLFDSKVNFIKPTNKELKFLIPHIKGKDKVRFKSTLLGNDNEFINSFVDSIEKRFDDYLFYCVTDNPESNLMWSHYANSHRGFCIEWDSNALKADKVTYQSEIPSFPIINIIKSHFSISNNHSDSEKIWRALRTKLNEWEYENEYRVQLDAQRFQGQIDDRGAFALVNFNPEWVKSIIFGCRMNQSSRDFIIENVPFETKFKKVRVDMSSIKVVEIN
ncbi:DUF2971 domain-containing protein [Vibrio harveyi]